MSEEGAHVIYKCTDVYNPKTEFGINLFDENINIKWPFDNKNQLIISDRDKNHPKFSTLNIV